ncbi:MAG TPA: DUF4399 domain-containing protein [Acidobacteriota bacterium]|nr:DUF4399 domain-containing protein [Acidobacteriota bacterium]
MNPRIRHSRPAPIFACLFVVLWLVGCATQETAPEIDNNAAVPDEPAASETAGSPEMFFTNMEEGSAYSAEHEVIFAAENFTIVPIEDPLVVREGEGHYHLAIDVDCVVAGEIIPPGTPSYVHFGTGNDRITLQFEPGEHRVCLQAADGEHRVIEGPEHSLLTKEIHFTVTEQ